MKTYPRPTAFLFVEALGNGLYESPGRCLAELMRNSADASMLDRRHWDPKQVRIEVWLEHRHPLTNGPVLIWLDHGCGLTDPNCDRYFKHLGTPISKLREDAKGNIGSSQKGIGRLSAGSINKKCLDDDIFVRIENGFYVFSRTQRTGKVRFVPWIPKEIEMDGIDANKFIDPTATEMGPLKNIQGTFTAIVIPTPVFNSHEEIREAIQWHLPREQDKMFNFTIGGKVIQPPALETDVNVTWKDGSFRARLGVRKNGTEGDGDGIWLCDDKTGLRVASYRSIGKQRGIPDPLWFPELNGDIFAPDLLRYQDTSRGSLAKAFVNSVNKDWQRLKMFMVGEVAPAAQPLIERDPVRGDAMDVLREMVDELNDRFGPPEEDDGPVCPPPNPPNPRPDGPKKNSLKPRPTRPQSKPPGRYFFMKVKDETYKLYCGASLDQYTFARVDPSNPTVVEINLRGGYKALPKNRQEQGEHCRMQVFLAIGMYKEKHDPYMAVRFANEVRSDLLTKKQSPKLK